MKNIIVLTAAAAFAASAHAGVIVDVVATGQVAFNGIGDPPLSTVVSGDAVVMSFQVDSDSFTDGVPGDVRGYLIDHSSFSMTFGGDVTQGLFPGAPQTYFGVVDGFPVSDGFFVSSSFVSPGGVPLEQDPFNANLEIGYTGDTLSSLDILDAQGTYDFTGLTSFGFTLWSVSPDFPAMEIEFTQMTITAVPAPATLVVLAPLAFGRRRRRI